MRQQTVIGQGVAAVGLLLAGLLLPGFAAAQDEDEEDEGPPSHTRQGADTCLKCHEDTAEFPVLSIFDTPHAVTADERTPFANAQCETCHGPGGEHGKRLRFGQERPPIPGFGDSSLWSVERENAVCQGCHRVQGHRFWQGSAHQRREVGCADCHRVHARHDPMTVTREQPGICLDCHVEQRAQVHRAYGHAIRQGQMDCTACHAPHGSLTESMLVRPTLNQTCYQCHAETRGPFLWEHAPVTEDCTLCHQPHGSNHPRLLTRRPPLLCQQCHARAGHPSIGRTTNDLPSGMPSAFMLGGSCTNCHSQVHGSNHPSGANLSR